MTGGQETVQTAKSIFGSTIVALAILFSAYALLNTIDPNLTTINGVILKDVNCGDTGCALPPLPTDNGLGGRAVNSNIGAPGSTIAGFNIGAYATSPNFLSAVNSIYNSLQSKNLTTADSVTAYMQSVASSTPLTGDMVLNSAKTYNVDMKLVLALMENDSRYGTLGKGARTHNPGNVGNDDAGNLVDYGNWQAGVDAVAKWLAGHRI